MSAIDDNPLWLTCAHDAKAVPVISEGNEALVDDLVRNGSDDGLLPEDYVHFCCPLCGANLSGLPHGSFGLQ